MKRSRIIYSIVNLVLLGILLTPVFAADYPTKPVTLIHGFGAGGAVDLSARTISKYFTKKWGQQIVVVSKPGGNLVPANVDVFNSKPDGYTLLNDCSAGSSFQVSTMRNLPYKLEDRTFMVSTITAPMAILCKAERPWKTLKEVADYVKREPGNFKWGGTGVSSSSSVGGFVFLDAIGVDKSKTKFIDYPTSTELSVGIAGGEIDFVIVGLGASRALIEAGKIRPLAFISAERVKPMPTIPTAKEAGFPTLDVVSVWTGISGPVGVPREIVEKWNRGMKEASADAEFISEVDKIGYVMSYLPPNEYKRMVLEHTKVLTDLFQKLGIR